MSVRDDDWLREEAAFLGAALFAAGFRAGAFLFAVVLLARVRLAAAVFLAAGFLAGAFFFAVELLGFALDELLALRLG